MVKIGGKVLGIEFLFAAGSYFGMLHYTLTYSVAESETERLLYLGLAAYLFVVYWAVATSNPGRLTDIQKLIINNEFGGMEEKLQQLLDNPDEPLEFESRREEVWFKSYFLPKDLIISSHG